ncbi:hypothetical protein [Flavobacterium sp.]|uniref:hypothetical protein n=1 Tax=Flavobacterium sp. TaxID=239 RepID=UPI0011F5FD67|nr:hypothetical protein [Flavobacterium sp.]RZJ72490.1 MAG: hypothetical protein EOO49_06135 [Flavobacterium sp.]
MIVSNLEQLESFEDIASKFQDENACIMQLEQIRWEGDVVSPFDETSKIYRCKDGRYRCRNSGKYFNVKTYTIFHNSKLPLQKWFQAIWLVKNSEDVTPRKLSEDLEITHKTAWLMQKRISKYIKTQTVIAKPNELVLTDWLNQLK